MKLPQTSKDFNRELNRINKDYNSLNAHVSEKLKEMIANNPDAVIFKTGNIVHTASNFFYKLSYNNLLLLNIDIKIEYLKSIENHIEKNGKYIQGKLF